MNSTIDFGLDLNERDFLMKSAKKCMGNLNDPNLTDFKNKPENGSVLTVGKIVTHLGVL